MSRSSKLSRSASVNSALTGMISIAAFMGSCPPAPVIGHAPGDRDRPRRPARRPVSGRVDRAWAASVAAGGGIGLDRYGRGARDQAIVTARSVPGRSRAKPGWLAAWSRTSGPAKEDRAEERFRRAMGVVRVYRERDGRGVVRGVTVDLLEVLGDVAALGEPLAGVGRARTDHDVRHRPGLLALADRADGLRGVPHVADDPRAQGLREARPHHEDLSGLIVGSLPTGVSALGEDRRLPGPFENGRLLEVDLALDVLRDRRAVVLAPETEDVLALVLDDGQIVRGTTPVLPIPSGRDAHRAYRGVRPVFDEDEIGGNGGAHSGEYEDGAQEGSGHGRYGRIPRVLTPSRVRSFSYASATQSVSSGRVSRGSMISSIPKASAVRNGLRTALSRASISRMRAARSGAASSSRR